MRTLKFLLIKEFKQIFRNRSLLPLIFIVPIVQLLILPMAANFEIKNINLSVVDHDHSSYSHKLIGKILSSGYFRLVGYDNSFDDAFTQIESDRSDLILEIPEGFEDGLVRENQQKLFVAINAINGVKAGLGGSYLASIITDYNSDIRLDWSLPLRVSTLRTLEVVAINWFNRFLNYNLFMVPGILVILVTIMCTLLCAINIVKEKEDGTIEQINVTPIKKHLFILGKLIPFWVIGMFEFSIGLFVVGRLVYGIIPLGSIPVLYSFLGLYLIAMLGFGLLLSTYSSTQQQAMSMTFFFIMIFILMSGLFTAIENMPEWAQVIARCNPVTYFMEVVRMIILKGSTFADIKYHLLIITGFALTFNTWAVLNYRKAS
jgi:ABC-2 type transport system permease protein